jgi:hypothetical protein
MFRKTGLIATAVVAAFMMLFSSNLYAQSFSLGLKAGTLGIGIEAEGNIDKTFGGRIGANYLSYEYSSKCRDCDVDFDYDVKSATFPVFLDWHPAGGSFRISGGIVFSNSQFEGSVNYSSSDDETEKIGDNKYRKGDIGNLDATVDFSEVNPYFGVGWDTSFGESKRFGFLCDLGFIFQRSPEVKLTSNGTLSKSSDPTFKSDLAKEEEDIQDSLNKWKYYPLVALGVSYRF